MFLNQNVFGWSFFSLIFSHFLYSDHSVLEKWALARFEKCGYAQEIKKFNMPIVKKYIDRPDYLEKGINKELTEFTNNLVKTHSQDDVEVFVLVAEEHDNIFMDNGNAKGAIIFNCIDKLVIIFEKVFFDNYSKDVMKAVLAHEVGHAVYKDMQLRYVYKVGFSKISPPVVWGLGGLFLLTKIYGLRNTALSNPRTAKQVFKYSGQVLKYLGYSFGVVGVSSFTLGIGWFLTFSKICRDQEFRADRFAMHVCGESAVLAMIQALSEIAPACPHEGVILPLFRSHPDYATRIAEIKKAAMNETVSAVAA